MSNDTYVSFTWDENTAQFTADFIKGYSVVTWKRLTADEEEALDVYLEYEPEFNANVPASEFWERLDDGDLFLDADGNFFYHLEQILPHSEYEKQVS